MRTRVMAIGILALHAAIASAGPALKAELVEVRKIRDQAPHSAFTDLVHFRGNFHCAFREGRGHVSTDGRIQVLWSPDAQGWTATDPVVKAGYDLRDAHLSVAPDGRLMLLGGAAPREKDGQGAPTGTFVAFSEDGIEWGEPQIVVEPGRWLWSVTWHKGKAYGVSYTAGAGERYLDLLASENGIEYKPRVHRLIDGSYPTETTLRFDSNDVCYALVRRDKRGGDPYSALLGISRGDYTKWDWHDLGTEFNAFGGPNFIQLPSGQWVAAGRMHEGGPHTALCQLDMKQHKMTKLLKFPSGGDTSYPGLLWHDGLLYMSYYSSHEGKTSIYLARIKIIM